MSKRGSKSKRKASLFCHGMSVTKERQRQNGGVVTEPIHEKSDGKTYIKRQRAVSECILDYYLAHNKITEVEHDAGMKFRRAYLRAVLRIWTDEGSGGSHGDPEMAALLPIISEQVLREAYGVLSPRQKAVIISVCGHDAWAGETHVLKTLHRGLAQLIKLWRLS